MKCTVGVRTISEIFSEIYSSYYNVIAQILNASLKNPLSKSDISEIINSNAFSESSFYIIPKLINGEWNLLDETDDGKFLSKFTESLKRPMTTLEKRWLKSLLYDKRIHLFLQNEQIQLMEESLKDVQPLFDVNDFYCYDNYSDGDDYEDETYINNFRILLKAQNNKKPINIVFESSKGKLFNGNYIPYKLEYSCKDDKFRVHVLKIISGRIVDTAVINIARITSVQPSKITSLPAINYEKVVEKYINKLEVVLQISKERNAVERCMLHFANFEKHTEYDESSDNYMCHIYYNKCDETELLIHILSFGPVIKVLGPYGFLKLVRERIKKQWELS